MKPTPLFAALTATVLICGCISTSNFQAWDGQKEFEGRGGAFTTKDGIDIYTVGEPKRKFHVLGVVRSKTSSSAEMMVLFGDSWSDSKLVKEAKARGGNAVILTDDRDKILGWSSGGNGGGSLNVSRSKVAVLVKYVD